MTRLRDLHDVTRKALRRLALVVRLGGTRISLGLAVRDRAPLVEKPTPGGDLVRVLAWGALERCVVAAPPRSAPRESDTLTARDSPDPSTAKKPAKRRASRKPAGARAGKRTTRIERRADATSSSEDRLRRDLEAYRIRATDTLHRATEATPRTQDKGAPA